MHRLFAAVVLALSLLFTPALSSAHDSKTTHVKSYTKKDGTHVAAHDRKSKDDSSSSKNEKKPSATPKASSSTTTRDSHGKIKRDKNAVKSFEKQTGYPKGRPGYVIDHIIPLACGGPDIPLNMQWQSAADAKAKDKIERKGC